MLLIGTQDSEEDASVGEKTIPEREHQKSYVAVAFEDLNILNVTDAFVFENAKGTVEFENADKNEELWEDSSTPGICCVKGV